MAEQLVSPAAVAEYLDVSTGQLAQLRYLGRGPEFIKIGVRVRYRMSTVEKWVEGQCRTTTEVSA